MPDGSSSSLGPFYLFRLARIGTRQYQSSLHREVHLFLSRAKSLKPARELQILSVINLDRREQHVRNGLI